MSATRRCGRWMAAGLGMTLLLLSSTSRGAEPPADVLFQRDLVYGATADGEQLKLNLAQPRRMSGQPLACILLIHGGGWSAGDRSELDGMAWASAQRGYVAATIGYRLAPRHPFPAQIQDVKCAVRYLRAHAEQHGIDPQRIGAMGFSAGAHLAMLLGTMDAADGWDNSGGWQGHSSKVGAVVAFFGPTDLTVQLPPMVQSILRNVLGGDPEQKTDLRRRMSPVTYVSAGDSPMLLFQGTNDPLVPYEQAIRMLQAMHRHHIPGRVELISSESHGWRDPEMTRTLLASAAFFQQYLRKPPASSTRPAAR